MYALAAGPDGIGRVIQARVGTMKELSADRGRQKWGSKRKRLDDAGGEFLAFTLFKQNKGTMDAVSAIARALKIKNFALSYAGTKDSRAVTTQRVAAHRVLVSGAPA